jgi:hypothetical protein
VVMPILIRLGCVVSLLAITGNPPQAAADNTAPPTNQQQSAAPADPNDPNSPHAPGLYCFHEAATSRTLIRIEPATYMKLRHGYSFSGASGHLTSSKVEIGNAHAAVQLAQHQPVFFYYRAGPGPGSADALVDDPDEFILTRVEISEKSRRVLLYDKIGISDGIRTDISNATPRGFTAEQFAPGAYRITPRQDLDAGEYWFIRQISERGTIFGFGIK